MTATIETPPVFLTDPFYALSEGQFRRALAFEQLEFSDPLGMETHAIRRAALWLANQGADFTIDDVRVFLPPVKPERLGSNLAALAGKGLIREVGRRKSTNPTNNARKVTVWRRVDLP